MITPIKKPVKNVKLCKCGKKRTNGSVLCFTCLCKKKKERRSELEAKKKERHLNSKGYYSEQVKKIEKECDVAWSLVVRKGCQSELSGERGDIKAFDAHHLVHRANKATRWDTDNGACLLKAEHRFKVHMDTFTTAILFERLKDKRGRAWFENLDCKRYMIWKPTLNELLEIKKGLEEQL
jgi:hypothetical protein